MKGASTIKLDKDSVMEALPHGFGSISSPEVNPNHRVDVVFVDARWQDTTPTLDYYRKLYTDAGYPPEAVESLVDGLSQSSLYDGKAT